MNLRAQLMRFASARERPYLAALHPCQAAFVADESKRKAALCGRRAGKSRGLGVWHYDGGITDPRGMSLFVAQTKGNARRILWSQGLEVVNRQLDLGMTIGEEDGQLMVSLPNGHKVWLAGCADRGELGKFRGMRFRRASIDEAQGMEGFLEELVEDVLSPALADDDGELAISGTPGPVPAGYFYEATTGDGEVEQWSTHRWTVRDNPFFRPKQGGGASYLEWLLKARKWLPSHPTYRREWLGEWVLDLGALIYPYDAEKNSFRELPEGEYTYALAVDLGSSKDEPTTAFVVAAHRKGHPEVYVISAEKRAGMTPSSIAARVEHYCRQYKFLRVVVDEGGLGGGYAEEMRCTYNIPAEAAEKRMKRGFQELVGGDLKSGVIKIDPYACRVLVDEMRVVQWDEEREEADERFADHACDAFLYVCRALRPTYRPEQEPPKPGTEEWHRAVDAKEREIAKRQVRENQRRRLWARR